MLVRDCIYPPITIENVSYRFIVLSSKNVYEQLQDKTHNNAKILEQMFKNEIIVYGFFDNDNNLVTKDSYLSRLTGIKKRSDFLSQPALEFSVIS